MIRFFLKQYSKRTICGFLTLFAVLFPLVLSVSFVSSRVKIFRRKVFIVNKKIVFFFRKNCFIQNCLHLTKNVEEHKYFRIDY